MLYFVHIKLHQFNEDSIISIRDIQQVKAEVEKTGGVNAMLKVPEGDFFVIHLMNKGFSPYGPGQSFQDILVALRNNRWMC